jgi:hypothetical protein
MPTRIDNGLPHILGMPIIQDLGMIPNICANSVTCEDTAATFAIRYHETKCGFPAGDDLAMTFATLPVDQMYPDFCPTNSVFPDPSDAPCINTTDDTSNGFLQWHLL